VEGRVEAEDRLDIQASLLGDGEAFARLVRRYDAVAARRMWRFTRDRLEHEALVQDVWVEVYLSLSGYKGRAPFSHWLSKVAVRTGYRFWKHRDRAGKRRAALAEADRAAWDRPDTLEPSEAAEALQRVLAMLPAKDRLILSLFYLDECNIAEIAEQTGWTRAMIKVRLHRARRKLKARLTAMGFGSEEHE